VTTTSYSPPRLTTRGRGIRIAGTIIATGILIYGSLGGSDYMFPFGPFRMYAGYYPPNGVITSTDVKARTADGHTVNVTQADTGIPRGDIEGELSAYEANPSMLGGLAAAYHRRHPAASPFISVQLVEQRWQLHDRKLVSSTTVVLSRWHA